MPNVADDPRAHELRHAFVREGINTVTVAPLHVRGEAMGALCLYHDQPHEWAADDVQLLTRIAEQGSTVVRNAENYNRMATWAAQLQSIQQLGARLTRLRRCARSARRSARARPAHRLPQRPRLPGRWRRLRARRLARRGRRVRDEDGEQLRLKVGQGITGWVAQHGVAQNLGDAAQDRRTQTIPGTDDDLDESLLLAPMLYDDEVIGVIVLAKLGLNQFGADDLRLLEIYASIAAQAMANADATERLRAQSEALARQLANQRELLRVTESILATLDTQTLLQEIAERLAALIYFDNIGVDVYDTSAQPAAPDIRPRRQRAEYLAATAADDAGVSGDAVRTGEAQLVQDELADQRVVHFGDSARTPGALIVAPLRSRDRVPGVLTVERLGEGARFTRRGVRAGQAVRRPRLDRAAERRHAPRRRDPRPDRCADRPEEPRRADRADRCASSSRAGAFSLLMVDLDFFKEFNDHSGPRGGQRDARASSPGCCATRAARATRSSATAATSSRCCCRRRACAGARTVAEQDPRGRVPRMSGGGRAPVDVTLLGRHRRVPQGRPRRDGRSIIAADRACYVGQARRPRSDRDRRRGPVAGRRIPADRPTPVEHHRARPTRPR